MTYKSVVVDYSPKAKKMAAAVEAKANEMALEGYELVTMSITGSAKAILLFKTEKTTADKENTPAQEMPDAAPIEEDTCPSQE